MYFIVENLKFPINFVTASLAGALSQHSAVFEVTKKYLGRFFIQIPSAASFPLYCGTISVVHQIACKSFEKYVLPLTMKEYMREKGFRNKCAYVLYSGAMLAGTAGIFCLSSPILGFTTLTSQTVGAIFLLAGIAEVVTKVGSKILLKTLIKIPSIKEFVLPILKRVIDNKAENLFRNSQFSISKLAEGYQENFKPSNIWQDIAKLGEIVKAAGKNAGDKSTADLGESLQEMGKEGQEVASEISKDFPVLMINLNLASFIGTIDKEDWQNFESLVELYVIDEDKKKEIDNLIVEKMQTKGVTTYNFKKISKLMKSPYLFDLIKTRMHAKTLMP